MGVTLTMNGRIKKGKQSMTKNLAVSFQGDGILKNYRMSRKEYAFRTEGGNLSRTSLYGATDLGLPTKTKGKGDPTGGLG
jgi:hypothetical protein